MFFRKPKKIQQRVFTAGDAGEEDAEVHCRLSAWKPDPKTMEDSDEEGTSPSDSRQKSKESMRSSSDRNNSSKDSNGQTKALLSFANEGEVSRQRV